MRPGIFDQRKKFEKYFWLFFAQRGHFTSNIAKILSKAENAQDCMPGRLRPG